MKYFLMSLSAILFSGSIYAQTILKKNNLSGDRKEIYYVLKSDTNTKQGPYKIINIYTSAKKGSDNSLVYYNDTLIVCSGFYKNNLKDSLWKFYSYKSLLEEGAYANDKRIGVWTAYNRGGEVDVRYDYSNNKLIDHKLSMADSIAFKVYVGDKTQFSILERVPIYLGGMDLLYNMIARNIRYPASAKENNIKGKVIVTFKIDTAGHVSDYQILKHLQNECDKEALRVVKLIPENWLPAMLEGKLVSVEYMLPITYALAD